MRPSKQEMQERADVAAEKLRSVARRSDKVRERAFGRISDQLPVERLDLHGTAPSTFHAVVYFKTTAEIATFDNSATRSVVEGEIKAALADIDPDTGEPEIRTDLDSIEHMETAQEGYFNKFR